MPLPTKEQINWSNAPASCPLPISTGNQKNDCKAGLNYTTCVNTVNGFISQRNTEVDTQVGHDHRRWENKSDEYQGWANHLNHITNERKGGVCGDCPAGWTEQSRSDGCGKGNHQKECKKTPDTINSEMQGYRDVKPSKPPSPVIASISAKATDCCMNEVNIVNSKVDNSKITQTCIKDGKTITQEVESSGKELKTTGSGSTSILNSSAKSSDQQQYMIIAIVIISIILSSSVLLLLLLT
jgi:hypothetical protein